ncbi:hypothetical protein PsYK624_156840 [Phanerochaete sordida]|uniref:Uncharacterized protein n=1 Tax=Phanerochaete sordida TaxID=48140 RepID=A0A9P3GPN3_9APHY|nr:hypothetical protein PsYK624_156840 [Phanerochaete sordida]
MSYPPSNLSKAKLEALLQQQGDEIRRLNSELKRAEDKNKRLQDELEAFRIAHADITGRLKGANKVIDEHNLVAKPPTTHPTRPQRTPTFKKQAITAFYVGDKIPAEYIRKAAPKLGGPPPGERLRRKRKTPTKHTIARLDAATLFSASYNTCTLLRPDAVRTPAGALRPAAAHAPFALGRTVHAVASLDGRAFYVGAFRCVARARASTDAYTRLPWDARAALAARVDPDVARRAETMRMIAGGKVALTRFTLHRVAYDARFQAALLKVRARHGGEPVGEDDVEDFTGETGQSD